MTVINILTIIGARPQFIKAAVVTRAIRQRNTDHQPTFLETIVHTGQHYDPNMSKVFFDELGLPEPVVNLNVSNASHGQMTARMLSGLERVMKQRQPDWVLIYGDTNSTLAAALAASKLNIPIAHVEAGLRSFNRGMPEEINRILSDQVSSILFCPTSAAVENLRQEGFRRVIEDWRQVHTDGPNRCAAPPIFKDNGAGPPGLVIRVGDVMFDAAIEFGAAAKHHSRVLESVGVEPNHYYLVTIHREENTLDAQRMAGILRALARIAETKIIVFPAHPRIQKQIRDWHAGLPSASQSNCRIIPPQSFFDMMRLEKGAIAILTDSGGIQKEAFFHKIPCITLRDETEWVETVASGWNQIVGTKTDTIISAINNAAPGRSVTPFGDGRAAHHIIDVLAAGYR